jgi:putative redox protein
MVITHKDTSVGGYAKDVTAVWREGTAFDLSAGSGHAVLADGDAQAGMSPMELLLAGLAGCTAADVIDILRKKRQDVTGLEVRTHGDRSETHPRVYTHVDVLFIVTGRNIEPEAVRRAIELSREKYCSATAMFRGTATVVCRHEIREVETESA